MKKISDFVAELIRPEVRALRSYHVPNARGLIKLDAMENPHSWPESLKPAWLIEIESNRGRITMRRGGSNNQKQRLE